MEPSKRNKSEWIGVDWKSLRGDAQCSGCGKCQANTVSYTALLLSQFMITSTVTGVTTWIFVVGPISWDPSFTSFVFGGLGLKSDPDDDSSGVVLVLAGMQCV